MRHSNHAIGDNAVRQFNAILPSEWTVSKPEDYGVDGVVEIFKDTKPTGYQFNYQSKGTSQSGEAARKLVIDVKTLRYYELLGFPTLIFKYVQEENIFYGIWSDKIDISNLGKGQKTHTISFTEENTINQNFFDSTLRYLEKRRIYLRKSLPIPISVKLDFKTGDIFGRSSGYLKFELEQKFRLSKAINTVSEIDNVVVTFEKKYVLIQLLDQRSKIFLIEEVVRNVEELYALILYNILELLFEYSEKEFILEEMYCYYNELTDKLKLVKVVELFDYLTKANMFHEALSLYELTIKLEGAAEIENLHIHFITLKFMINDKSILEKWNQISSNLGQFGIQIQTEAMSHYNKGNFLANTGGDIREATKEYILAQKIDPSYRERFYFWREYGGCLFTIKHYLFAKNAYEKAMEKEKSSNLYHLIADCLFNCGKYDEALAFFDKYFKVQGNIRDNDAIWLCKIHYVNTISILLNIDNNSAKKSAKKAKIKLEGEGFEKKLRNNDLNSVFWFNQAVYLNKINLKIISFKCFSNCLIIDPYDFESYENAFKLFIENEELTAEFIVLYKYLSSHHGEKMIIKTLEILKDIKVGLRAENILFESLEYMNKTSIEELLFAKSDEAQVPST